MTTDDAPPPRDWPSLRAYHAARPLGSLRNFAYYLRELDRFDPTSPLFGPPYAEAAASLCRGTVFGEGEAVATAIRELTRLAAVIVASDAPTLDRVEPNNLGAVAALALAECAGWEPGPPPVEVPLVRLLHMEPAIEEYRRSTIWAHLAYGRVEGIEALLLEDPSVAPDPEATFPSPFHTQVHLARCVSSGAPAELALPAWRAYLGHFPIDLAAESATYPELVWAARAVHVAVLGHDPATVIDWLRREIA